MKKLYFFIAAFLITNANMFAQVINFSPTSDSTAKITLEGYVDTYFGFDFSEPADANMPYFVSQNRHNEFNINLAYISLKYTSDRVRATFTPGFGTYMNSNYAAERITLRNIVEADVGVKLFKNKDIWLDAGVIGSPFTNESAISFDQPTLTRSFASEYVPYFVTGARLTIPIENIFTAYLFLLNGWQVIEAVNPPLAFASEFEYKPTDKLTFTLNTFYGYEQSASAPKNRIRTLLDFYTVYKPGKFSFTLSSYVGNQQRRDSLDVLTDKVWWQINGTARYSLTEKHSIVARVEYFNDPHSVMITPVTGVKGFISASYSLGYNLAITPSVLFRVEGRYFQSPDDVFTHGNMITNNHTVVTGGLTAKF
jgi:hypothetical protein